VELAELPSRRVYLAASELQAYINAMPRLVTESLYLDVTGELDTAVEVKNFYGPGTLTIVGNRGFTIRNTLSITDCAVFVYIYGVNLQEREMDDVLFKTLLNAERSRCVSCSHCCFTGLGNGTQSAAIRAVQETMFEVSQAKISGCKIAAIGGHSSVLSIESSEFNGNVTGVHAEGGMVLLGSGIPDLLGANTNVKLGGIIVKADGTLL